MAIPVLRSLVVDPLQRVDSSAKFRYKRGAWNGARDGRGRVWLQRNFTCHQECPKSFRAKHVTL